MHFAAFDTAHIQYIINQAEQMIAGGHNLFEVFLHQLFLVDVSNRKRRKAHNGVHRRADIVGHVGKEHAFRLAGAVCLGKRILQKVFLFHFPADILIHTVEAKDNPVAFFPYPRTDGLHLEVDVFPLPYSPVIYAEHILFLKFFLKPCYRGSAFKHLPVVFMNIFLYVYPHRLFKG